MGKIATAGLKIKFEHEKAMIVAWFLGLSGFR